MPRGRRGASGPVQGPFPIALSTPVPRQVLSDQRPRDEVRDWRGAALVRCYEPEMRESKPGVALDCAANQACQPSAPVGGDPEYWVLTVRVARARSTRLEEWLRELGFAAMERRDAPGALVELLVYDTAREPLESAARRLEERAGLEGASGPRCEISPLGSEWRLAWTQHLVPVQLTPRITLVPHAPGAERSPCELYLEPAFAFGFGEHASTRLLARWLEKFCEARPGISVLDVGAGTGVLALIAGRSGAGRVVGVDTSADAVRAARANAALNGALGLELVHGAIERVSGRFDCVVANIEANVLIDVAEAVAARVAVNGALGLAGLLASQAADVARRYALFGIRLEITGREGEWVVLGSSPPSRGLEASPRR